MFTKDGRSRAGYSRCWGLRAVPAPVSSGSPLMNSDGSRRESHVSERAAGGVAGDRGVTAGRTWSLRYQLIDAQCERSRRPRPTFTSHEQLTAEPRKHESEPPPPPCPPARPPCAPRASSTSLNTPNAFMRHRFFGECMYESLKKLKFRFV